MKNPGNLQHLEIEKLEGINKGNIIDSHIPQSGKESVSGQRDPLCQMATDELSKGRSLG